MENQKVHKSNRIKKSGHIKLKSSGQLLTNNHNFKLAITELPESFFENMVLTEIDLSEEFSMDKFYKLINLYSEAIEFYTQYDPPQVKYYKGRMESLLTKRDTLMKLKKEGQNMTKKEENNINMNNNNLSLNNSNSSSINLNRSELMNKIDLRKDVLVYEDISKQVNKFMNINNNTQHSTGIETIKKDLENQKKKWKEKLKKKKKNMLRYSYNVKMTHQKGMSLDIVNSYSSDDARNIKINYNKNNDDNALDKYNKTKNIFNQDNFEEVKEVKEENEDEIYDNEKENGKKFEDNNINEIKPIEINTNSQDIKDNNNINLENKNKNENSNQKTNIKEKEEKNEAEVEIDDKILTSVNEKIDLLNKLLDDIESNKLSKDEEEEILTENENDIEIIKDIVKVPLKFQSAYFSVEELINNYISEFNNFFFKEIFEQFAQNLKDIYDTKYKKYIEVSLEYHHQIKENEHILENHKDFSEEKKEEIQQIIDSLKDEQQNQIAKIEDEFNRLIVSKVNEFKIDSFKNNSGILLIEEKLKLDIYSIINESFIRN